MHTHCYNEIYEGNPPCGIKGKHRCCLCGSLPKNFLTDTDIDVKDIPKGVEFIEDWNRG